MSYKEVSNALETIEVPQVPTATPSPAQILAFIAAVWPLFVPLLKLIKVFTGSKGDEKIDAILAWGEYMNPQE